MFHLMCPEELRLLQHRPKLLQSLQVELLLAERKRNNEGGTEEIKRRFKKKTSLASRMFILNGAKGPGITLVTNLPTRNYCSFLARKLQGEAVCQPLLFFFFFKQILTMLNILHIPGSECFRPQSLPGPASLAPCTWSSWSWCCKFHLPSV